MKKYRSRESNPGYRYSTPTFYQLNHLERYLAYYFSLSYVYKAIATAKGEIFFRETQTLRQIRKYLESGNDIDKTLCCKNGNIVGWKAREIFFIEISKNYVIV